MLQERLYWNVLLFQLQMQHSLCILLFGHFTSNVAYTIQWDVYIHYKISWSPEINSCIFSIISEVDAWTSFNKSTELNTAKGEDEKSLCTFNNNSRTYFQVFYTLQKMRMHLTKNTATRLFEQLYIILSS